MGAIDSEHAPELRADAEPGPVVRGRSHTIRWAAISIGAVVILTFGFVFGTRFGKDPTIVDSPLIGGPAPEFELPGLDGGTVRSADLADRPYVVNFWASWCVPCREEAAALQAFYEAWSAAGVELVGIVWNDEADEAREFRNEFGLTFPQATDPGSRTALDFGVFGIPETYVIDDRGVVMAKFIGRVTLADLEQAMQAVLAGRSVTGQNKDDYRTQRP